jgi:hypothetical protein
MLNDSIEETDIESKARNLLKEEEEKTEKQEIPKRKNRYEVEVNDTELQTLSTTLDLLNSRDIINYNLDNLKMKIDHFSINKKEEFLKLLKDDFSQSIKGYNNSIDHFYLQVQSMKLLSDSDLSKVNSLYTGIQKIEEKNHRIELRNQNKKKLLEYMKNLLDQLTITPQRKEVLLHTEYISTSELVIVNEVLKNFVEFYKNRKKQDIDMDIINEGQEIVKGIISDLIKNFGVNVYNFLKKNKFVESDLFRRLPTFRNPKINEKISQMNIDSINKQRISLKNYFLDRKFFVQKLNALFDNQEDLNEIDAFTLCRQTLSKGLRDVFAMEFNNMVEMWEVFFKSHLLDENKYNLYLDSETFINYDPFLDLKKERMYEANKFFSSVILNVFFNCDIYIDEILTYFNEAPMFNIEKNTKAYNEVEQIISIKVYDSMSKNIDSSIDKSILLGLLIYTVLVSIQDVISKNNLESDFAQINLQDIFEPRKNEDDLTMSQYEAPQYDDDNISNYGDIGIFKISSQETKNFISKNINKLREQINVFLKEQKEIISNYTCEIRRIGIIPIVKKTINFLKLILAITNGIKTEIIYEIVEEFKIILRNQIEKLAASNKKYTNIVLAENYHYILRFFKTFADSGLNVDNPKLVDFEREFQTLYNHFKKAYIYEIFDYQFHDFYQYYNSFKEQYKTSNNKVKLQNQFSLSSFEKKVNNFLKEINKNIDKMAKRVIKHYCIEEKLAPEMWLEEVEYWTGLLKDIQIISSDCYGKTIEVSKYMNMIGDYDFIASYSKK